MITVIVSKNLNEFLSLLKSNQIRKIIYIGTTLSLRVLGICSTYYVLDIMALLINAPVKNCLQYQILVRLLSSFTLLPDLRISLKYVIIKSKFNKIMKLN